MAVTAKKPAKTKNSIKLQPIGDRIVVDRDATDEVTIGGIYLPENAKDKPQRGTVISVGDGKLLASGKRSTPQVKVGDRVIFTSYGPDEIKIGTDEFLLMREDDVLAVIG